MNRLALPLATVLFAACSPPDEAPEELNEPVVHLFSNFDDPTTDLVPYVEALDEYARTFDPTLPPADRAFTQTNLTDADLAAVEHPDTTTYPLSEISPVAIVGQSRHNMAANRSLVNELNHVCIESETTKVYRRTMLEGDPCFVDGTCDRANTTNEVWKKNVLADLWYDMEKDYRWMELSDGREAMIARTWTKQAFAGEGGANGLDHGHGIELWAEHPDDASVTTRVYATWFNLRISLLGADAVANLTRDGMAEGMTFADEFLDGKIVSCGNDRDKTAERPKP